MRCSFWFTVPELAGKSGSGKSVLMNGTSTSSVHAAAARPCSNTPTERSSSANRSGARRRSTRAVPCSSDGRSSARTCASAGRAALVSGPSTRTPGRASAAVTRTVGIAAFTSPSAGPATRSVSRSAGIDASSAPSSRTSAPVVTARSVTRPFSASSSSASAPATRGAAAQPVAHVLARLLAEGRVAGDGEVAQRRRQRRQRLPEPLGPALVERGGVLLHRGLEVRARVRLQRADHVGELHRRGGLVARDHLAVADRRARPGCPARPPRRSCRRGRSAGAASARRPP